MKMVSQMDREYVESVAGEPVSDADVLDFLHGLNEFNQVYVEFDSMDNEGFLVTRNRAFETMKSAMEFIRHLNRKAIIR